MNGRFRAAAPPHVRVLDRPQWADFAILVNSVSLGLVETDLAGEANMTPEAGTAPPVQHALDGDLSGRFAEPDGKTPW